VFPITTKPYNFHPAAIRREAQFGSLEAIPANEVKRRVKARFYYFYSATHLARDRVKGASNANQSKWEEKAGASLHLNESHV